MGIIVLDFGGQYAPLIATKVRAARVLAEIRQPDDPVEAFEGFKGIILSGSPALASQGEATFSFLAFSAPAACSRPHGSALRARGQ